MMPVIHRKSDNNADTKIDTCPERGAKALKKSSFLTRSWRPLIVIAICVASQSSISHAGSRNGTASAGFLKVATPGSSWSTQTSKDEMTEKISAYALSPDTPPTRRMSFPYGGVTSNLVVACNGKSEWVYTFFSEAPNLTGDEIRDNYNLIRTRIKWNEQIEDITLTQDWGAKFIHFENDVSAISKISTSDTVLLELHWYSQGAVYFKYSLQGSSKAIEEIRSKCATGG